MQPPTRDLVHNDPSAACPCGDTHPPGARFYVSVRDAGRTGLLAGPFETHSEALAHVEPARNAAVQQDPWAHFYAFGTLAMSSSYEKPGLLNASLGLPTLPSSIPTGSSPIA